jgi:transcriptional regulator with GAF, ATPase, and Fis domain
LDFEKALAAISALFSNPSYDLDQKLKSGLKILAKGVESDLGMLVTMVDADNLVTQAWVHDGLQHFPDEVLRDLLLPWLQQALRRGEITASEGVELLTENREWQQESMQLLGVKSWLFVPFRVDETVIGGIAAGSLHSRRDWDEVTVSRVKIMADFFANALARKRADEQLRQACSEIRRLKEQIDNENAYLHESEISLDNHSGFVASSTGIRVVLRNAEQVARTDSVVLVLGETGTGKELIARIIHDMSRRSHLPMIKVNCAALPATLIESELFGREKGAYTGALARETGRFELADKSTIFLDEIGELPLELQSKLLRVLQEGEFERLGSSKTIRADLRVIAATNRDLRCLVKEGKFREDLYYRLNVFPILIPPLRERREDIAPLVWHILRDLGKRMGRNIEGVHASTMRVFQSYSWPGNVRELRNVIERNLILSSGSIFRAEFHEQEDKENLRRLAEVESDYFRTVLHKTHWRIRGQGGAAELLGLKPTTLEARLKKLGIRRPN